MSPPLVPCRIGQVYALIGHFEPAEIRRFGCFVPNWPHLLLRMGGENGIAFPGVGNAR